MTLRTTAAYQMGGIIIWGKGENMENPTKCDLVYNYMTTVFGPALTKVKAEMKQPDFFTKMER